MHKAPHRPVTQPQLTPRVLELEDIHQARADEGILFVLAPSFARSILMMFE